MNIKSVVLSLSAASIALLGLSSTPVLSKEVTIRGASCFPIGSPVSKPFEGLVNSINSAGKGVIQIKLIGGAPAIGSPFTIIQKVSKGVFDIAGCPDAYYGNVVPESKAVKLSEYSATEMRKNGAYAFFNTIMAKKNLKSLGHHMNFGPFFLWSNVEIKKADLSGLHLRVSPVYTPFFKALGATVQRSNITQIYTYMENGTVKGYGWPALGWIPAWAKITKYRIEPGFYQAPIETIVNLKVWNKLKKAEQDIIMKVLLPLESKNAAWEGRLKKQNAKTAKQGLKGLKLTGDEKKKWTAMAKKAGWDEVLQLSPVDGPKLKKMFTK
jgi:TRAP-type C4-dicarboxylate transport system substrate-binding protein